MTPDVGPGDCSCEEPTRYVVFGPMMADSWWIQSVEKDLDYVGSAEGFICRSSVCRKHLQAVKEWYYEPEVWGIDAYFRTVEAVGGETELAGCPVVHVRAEAAA